MKDIQIEASLDQNKKCINIFGDGAASITFDVDATQLAGVLGALVQAKGNTLLLTIKPNSQKVRGNEEKSKLKRRAFKG